MLRRNFFRMNESCKLISSPKMRKICRGNSTTAFTRDRDLPFYDVLYLSLIKKGKTLSTELFKWFKLKKGDGAMSTSSEAYLKQRRNLNPEAFLILNDNYMENFYKTNEKILDRGYIVTAIDGTDFEIPNTPDNRDYFGHSVNQFNHQNVARASSSAIYDVNNDFIINIEVDKYDTDVKFIIRLKSKDFKSESRNMKSNDELTKIYHLYSRMQFYKKKYPEFYKKIIQKEYTELRIIKTLLKSKTEEKLITNLNYNEFNTEQIVKLYGQRWSIEESFNTLKNKLKIESFTGYSKQFIYQDIYAQTFIYNMLQDMIHNADEKLQQDIKNSAKQFKNRRKINENKALGLMKEELIHILLCENDKSRGRQYMKLVKSMERYTSTVRSGLPPNVRHWNKSNIYRTNLKDSF